MNKRGGWVEYMLTPTAWTVIALGAVLIYLLFFIRGLGEADLYQRPFLAASASGIIDTMLVPQEGNAILFFHPQKPEFRWDYSFDFKQNQVSVFLDNELEAGAGKYYYFSDRGIRVEQKTLDFQKVNGSMVFPTFLRQGDTLRIFDSNKEYIPINKFSYTCPKEAANLDKITIDPGHGYDEATSEGNPGIVYQNFRESEITRQISKIIKQRNQNRYVESTRDLDKDQQASSRVINTKSVLSIQLNEADENNNVIKAYVNAKGDYFENSMNFACKLINQVSEAYLSTDIPITGAVIVPVIPEHRTDKSFEILRKDKIGVILEAGNIKILKDISRQKILGEAIGYAS